MIENQENVRSISNKGYHAVSPPYTGNYIPPKPDLMFIDEQVESESMDVVSTISSGVVKTVESKVESVDVKNKGVYIAVETKIVRKNSFSPSIIKDWNSNNESEVEFEPKVEVKTIRPYIEKIKFVKTAREKVKKNIWKRFQVTPKTSHLYAMKRIFRYLKGQPKLGFWKSTIGGCQFLGKRLILWPYKKQTIVANSTTKAEYVAAASCYEHVLWIQNQMLDYGFNLMNTKEDRMERTATTASSLEAKQDSGNIYKTQSMATLNEPLTKGTSSGNGPRYQVTILGGAEAQTRFEAASKQSNDLPLSREKPSKSEGFEQIIDFLNAKPIINALTVNPTVYALCVKQFWTTAKVKKVNGQEEIQALVDNKQVESSKEKDSLGAQEDASKQGRNINDIDQDAKTALVDEAQGRIHDADMFGVDDLEVTAASVEDSSAPTTATTADVNGELTLAETLIAIKAAKPKVISTAITTPKAKEPEKPLKKKDQIALDKEVARKLEVEIRAKIEEEERITGRRMRQAVIKEWDDVQAIIDADSLQEGKYFVDIDTENVEVSLKKTQAKGSSKRAGQELEQESAKKQKLDEQEQAKVADDTIELKRFDYKIYREGNKSYFKIIRADGTMFKNFNREDLEVLRSIVKEMFKKTKPVDDMENLLFQTLKTMFEPYVEDII
nr:hypothetical protein [Tanacetum cinerariifolium]